MICSKLYSIMTATERDAWLKEYTRWLSDDFPKVESGKGDVKTVVEQGLHLLASFPYCRSFVQESLAVRDYGRRMRVLRRYADRVTADVEKYSQRKIDLSNPMLLVPHVGRPTKEEVAARELARKKKLEEENTLFESSDLSECIGDDNSSRFPIVPSGRMPSLAEIRWLMSPGLQRQSDTIRDLRSRFEEASTRAKQMAEDHRPASDIEPLAKEASRFHDEVEGIYSRIDSEMQSVYVRLNEDTAYIAEVEKISRLSNKELRTLLRPYWDKLSPEEKDVRKSCVIEQIKANDPEQATIRKETEAKKKAVADIRKYLQRTDKPNTLARLKGMEEKLAALRCLIGDGVDKYMPLLIAAREDYERNVRPAQEAKRAARAKRRAEKKALRSKNKEKS